jgi:hypothetical protein
MLDLFGIETIISFDWLSPTLFHLFPDLLSSRF